MKLRLLAAGTVAVALLGSAPGANAALPPQIVDAPTDAKGGQKAYDIASVTFDSIKQITAYKTTGKGKKKKRVPVFTPTDMTITMAMGAAPNIQPGTSYQVFADETPCGTFIAYSYWRVGAAAGPRHAMQFGECGPAGTTGNQFSVTGFDVTTVGNNLVWKIPFKAMPPEITKAKSAVFSGLFAYTAVTEPVVGYSPVDFTPSAVPNGADTAAIDYASSTNVYKLGS